VSLLLVSVCAVPQPQPQGIKSGPYPIDWGYPEGAGTKFYYTKLNLVKKSESGGGNSGLRAEKIASPFHTQISSEFS